MEQPTIACCSSTQAMSDSDEFLTSGQALARKGSKALLPGWLQALGELAFGKLAEHRDNEYRRGLRDLLATFAAAEDDEQTRESLAAILESPKRTHELLGHLNDLTFSVHNSARTAYLALAADSLSGKVGSELARDVGHLLRRVSGREASMLKKIVRASKRGPVDPGFKSNLNHQQIAVATLVINRLIEAGLASPLSASSYSLTPGTPRWGCALIDEDHRHTALQRYAELLQDAL